jgi:polar amino acid transport system substrate-binding protein
MMGRLAAGLLVCVALLAGSGARAADAPACQPDKVAALYPSLAGKTIKVGQDGVTMPFSYHDPDDPDKVIGLDADLARAVFACVGVPATIDVGAWAGLLPAVASGRIDVMWDDLYYTPERATRVDYVMYMAASDTAVLHKGNPKNITSLDNLCGVRALAGLGTVEAAMLNTATVKCSAEGKPAVEINTFQDRSTAWPMIENDRADIVLSSAAMAAVAISQRSAGLQAGFSFLPDIKVGIAVAKGRTELATAIANALAALKANGQAAKLFVQYKVDPALIMVPEIVTK